MAFNNKFNPLIQRESSASPSIECSIAVEVGHRQITFRKIFHQLLKESEHSCESCLNTNLRYDFKDLLF